VASGTIPIGSDEQPGSSTRPDSGGSAAWKKDGDAILYATVSRTLVDALLIDTVLAHDKEFVQWRAHTTSFVPSAKSRPHRSAGAVRRAQHAASPSGESVTVAASPDARCTMLRRVVKARPGLR
jgi:hypothetical protein